MGAIVELGTAFLDDRVDYTLEVVGEVSTDWIKKEISIACPEYNTGKGGHSPPGGPPYRETGLLMAGIEWEDHPDESRVTIMSSRVGTLVPGWIEFGTKYMTARPYMTPAMLDTDRICGDGIRYGMNPDGASAGALRESSKAVSAETARNLES